MTQAATPLTKIPTKFRQPGRSKVPAAVAAALERAAGCCYVRKRARR
jgi:hypothetical protein